MSDEATFWRMEAERHASPKGTAVVTTPEPPTPQGVPSARVFTWDWKGQPDMADIAAAVTELSGGRVLMREIETGSSDYAWVVSDAELTDEQAWRLYSGETVTSTKGD